MLPPEVTSDEPTLPPQVKSDESEEKKRKKKKKSVFSPTYKFGTVLPVTESTEPERPSNAGPNSVEIPVTFGAYKPDMQYNTVS